MDFQTLESVCKYMVSLIPDGISTVLEPTPGKGNLVRALNGYQVTAPSEFWDVSGRFDAVVMNPPFYGRHYIKHVNHALKFLKPGGVLVYSTCSLEPEENEQAVEAFTRRHPAFRLTTRRALTPWADGVDGAFVAALTFQPLPA